MKKEQQQLREICLSFPETTEVLLRRGPTYRVRKKIFALDRTVENKPSLWCKAPLGFQEIELSAQPQKIFFPPYYGPKGWIGVWLNRETNWKEVTALIRRSYRLIAPSKLSQALSE